MRKLLKAKNSPPKWAVQTVEKGVLTPWPPLRGGSARRRWGRELYGCPGYFCLMGNSTFNVNWFSWVLISAVPPYFSAVS